MCDLVLSQFKKLGKIVPNEKEVNVYYTKSKGRFWNGFTGNYRYKNSYKTNTIRCIKDSVISKSDMERTKERLGSGLSRNCMYENDFQGNSVRSEKIVR